MTVDETSAQKSHSIFRYINVYLELEQGELLSRHSRIAMIAVLTAFNILGFQNCSPYRNSNSTDTKTQASASGNGDGYSGKISVFNQIETSNPCSATDTNGNPLPNGKILLASRLDGGQDTFLIRQGCQDIAASNLAGAGVTSANGSLTYQGKQFNAQINYNDFQVIKPVCPSGKTLDPNVTPTNLFPLSQNFLAIYPVSNPGWYADPGIGVEVAGAINSIPSFSIVRNDPGKLDQWRRTGQVAGFLPNTDYVFSILLSPGTISSADWHYVKQINANASSPQDESISVTCDLANKIAIVNWAVNINNVSATVAPLANGFQCMVYFTSSAIDTSDVAIGIAPATGGNDYGHLGDSIFATAAQLVRIGEICK